MGGIKDCDKNTKDSALFYMDHSVKTLPHSCIVSIAKDPRFHNLFLHAAKHAPGPVKPLAEKVRKAASEALAEAKAKKKSNGKNTRKRSDPSQEDLPQQTKRAKTSDADKKTQSGDACSEPLFVSVNSVLDEGCC